MGLFDEMIGVIEAREQSKFKRGDVVRFKGRKRRYVITFVSDPAGINMTALSGAIPGSGPSGHRDAELELDKDQTTTFTGKKAKALSRSYERYQSPTWGGKIDKPFAVAEGCECSITEGCTCTPEEPGVLSKKQRRTLKTVDKDGDGEIDDEPEDEKDDEDEEDEEDEEDDDEPEDEKDDDQEEHVSRFDELVAEGCKTPGMKKHSKGKGKGLARGDGEGPMGEPAEESTSRFDQLVGLTEAKTGVTQDELTKALDGGAAGAQLKFKSYSGAKRVAGGFEISFKAQRDAKALVKELGTGSVRKHTGQGRFWFADVRIAGADSQQESTMSRFDKMIGLAGLSVSPSGAEGALTEAGGLKSGMPHLTHKVWATGGEFGRDRQLMAAFYSEDDAYEFVKGKKTSTFVKAGGKYVFETFNADESALTEDDEQAAGDVLDEWEQTTSTKPITEADDVAKAQKELLHLIGMLRTLALKHTKRLSWASNHGENYQDAARDAKQALQKMTQQLGFLH
jgi:hypothetical protein